MFELEGNFTEKGVITKEGMPIRYFNKKLPLPYQSKPRPIKVNHAPSKWTTPYKSEPRLTKDSHALPLSYPRPHQS